MVGFHAPSFAIERGDLVVSKVEVAGNQIEDTAAAIFVVKTCLTNCRDEGGKSVARDERVSRVVRRWKEDARMWYASPRRMR